MSVLGWRSSSTERAGHFSSKALVAVFVLTTMLATTQASPLPVVDDPATRGEWTLPASLRFGPIHAQVLPTGKLLVWRSSSDVAVWDPATGALDAVPAVPQTLRHEINCAGHIVLADGRVLIAGGSDLSGGGGAAEGSVYFDPSTNTWTVGPRMNVGRWYPTLVASADGVFAAGGVAADDPPLIERLGDEGAAWHTVEGAEFDMLTYPQMSPLPDGRIVRTGPESEVMFFDPQSGTWQEGPRFEASGIYASVLLPGLQRVLALGIGQSSLAVANPLNSGVAVRILELGSEPTWRPALPLNVAPSDMIGVNAVLLPDGNVMTVGGGMGPNVPQLFDTKTETWTTLATGVHSRGHHSVAVLLPDGRVFSSGGDNFAGPFANPASVEIYSPPYLFRGARPTVTAAPAATQYAVSFEIETPDAASIQRVALVGLGANTHGVNFGQRYVDLTIQEKTSSSVVALSPATSREAPPGWYMLFVVNGNGVPSIAKMVRVGI